MFILHWDIYGKFYAGRAVYNLSIKSHKLACVYMCVGVLFIPLMGYHHTPITMQYGEIMDIPTMEHISNRIGITKLINRMEIV